jgi:hypothetical protein
MRVASQKVRVASQNGYKVLLMIIFNGNLYLRGVLELRKHRANSVG